MRQLVPLSQWMNKSQERDYKTIRALHAFHRISRTLCCELMRPKPYLYVCEVRTQTLYLYTSIHLPADVRQSAWFLATNGFYTVYCRRLYGGGKGPVCLWEKCTSRILISFDRGNFWKRKKNEHPWCQRSGKVYAIHLEILQCRIRIKAF